MYENYDEIDKTYVHQFENYLQSNYYYMVRQIAKGEDVKVAIIDSGIDIFHPCLYSNIKEGFSYFNNNEHDYIDRVGHGTFLSGIIAKLLPNIKLYVYKVTDDFGNMSDESIIAGLKWSLKKEVNVICMAIGTPTDYDEIHNVVKQLYNNGVIIVTAAGNYPDLGIDYPAKYVETICISGRDFNDNVEFSQNGPGIDAYFPSVNIPSTFACNNYAISSGSSIATALATAFIAILQDLAIKKYNETYTFDQIKTILKTYALNISDFNDENMILGQVPSFKFLNNCNYNI
jgi:subtilisin